MAQQTKTRSQQSEAVEETAPDTSRSKEKVEEANCCLSNIDDLLNECDTVLPDPEPEAQDVPLPAWHPDAEWDVDDGDAPEEPSFAGVISYMESIGKDDNEEILALHSRAEEAFEERNEEYQEQYLSGSRTSRWGSCTC